VGHFKTQEVNVTGHIQKGMWAKKKIQTSKRSRFSSSSDPPTIITTRIIHKKTAGEYGRGIAIR